jgi:hypothetical protein
MKYNERALRSVSPVLRLEDIVLQVYCWPGCEMREATCQVGV